MHADRIDIPKSLQKRVTKQLHTDLLGVSHMKALMSRYVYWSGMDREIKYPVKSY